jgi:ornithine cyclodeaminase/alanine dehydrogenase-like protein (mu-crystallin family)
MDGAYLTGLRTAAGSAVATRHLARPDARSLGVFGTGVQARYHIEAIRRVRDLRTVLVAGSSRDKAAAFAAEMQAATGLEVRAATAAEAAAADIVAVGTTSPTPVLAAQDVQPGAHVNAVGAFTPTTRELPTDLVTRARVYVDTRAGAYSEAGDLVIPVQEGAYSLDAVVGEVGEVVLGSLAGRGGADEVTIYKSVGAAFLDAATARLAYLRATNEGVGQAFEFQA